jgi:ABC-type antimicrobial peptide transport system permease subunit
MIEQLGFYARHSITDLRVNRQRTFFALLCIAAGVAAIVSLGTLAAMIQNTLTGNLQVSNRGDVQVETFGGFRAGSEAVQAQLNAAIERGDLTAQSTGIFGGGMLDYSLTPQGVETLRSWFDANYPGSTLTYRMQIVNPAQLFFGTGPGVAVTVTATGANVNQVSPILIEGAVYPLYGAVVSQSGTPLAQMLSASTDIVLSDRIARDLGASVGDVVRLNGADADFTVRGIIDESQEITSPTQALEALFGFYLLDASALQHFPDLQPTVGIVYIRLPESALTAEALNNVSVALLETFPYLDSTTTEDLRQNYEQIAVSIDQLTTVMGLVSLLIGAIGIVNTMQVIVRRRTLEVAVLKTIGLQANQVTTLFLVEALIMGVIGAAAGVLLGWALVFAIRGTAEQLLATPLPFAIDIGAALTGFVVGVLVTAVFGFLPTLTAGQVRPSNVLRPNDSILPRAGCLRTLITLVGIVLALALIAQGLLGGLGTALAVIAGAFIAAGVLYGLLSLLIWLFGRFFPAFGIVDLRISLRQMLAGRSRAAVTLLALVIGVFSLSLITLLADSINGLLRFTLTEASGGNVVISVASPSNIPDVEALLDGFDGTTSYTTARSYRLTLVGLQEGDTRLSLAELDARLEANRDQVFPFGGPPPEEFSATDLLTSALGDVGEQDADRINERPMQGGRNLTAADAGTPVAIIQSNPVLNAVGIDVGDRLIYTLDGAELTFDIIGSYSTGLTGGGFASTTVTAAPGALPDDLMPSSVFILANIAEDRIVELRRELSAIRGTFVIETAAFTQLIQSLLGTFTAFPTMVALLGLIVGGVVIANSVALTTLERRREIAIMKAVGLQRERVLFMILLENGILGLIGGLIGVGIGLVGLVIAVASFQGPSQSIPLGSALVLMLLCIAVALVAALTTAWGASGEKPLNVLRYE